MTNEIDNHFIPHVTDVLDVKSVLWQKKLPVELIDSIIGIAEYWPRYVASVENPVTVVRDGKVLYIQSQPLPGLLTLGSLEDGGEREELVVGGVETSTINPARRIVFRIWSHDQGWSSNRGRGTYFGSYSWFETFAERPLSVQAVQLAAELPSPTDIVTEAELRELQSSGENVVWQTVAVPETTKREDGIETVITEKKVWHVQSNVHAMESFKEHEIIWNYSDDDGDEISEDEEAKTGAGKGGDFVRLLRSGDRIRVIARAMVGCLRDPGFLLAAY
ncbi:hypothetical protein Q9L58_009603 [Maublancomyces gigas]|uniref:Uncharacterized protein n=1 Tax=Discina gigas TaxID=1032678 RepID=A0ABR3G6M3_9PEZI